MNNNYISIGSDWTFESLEAYEHAIDKIATEKYKLDIYPNQIEVISSEQMMDAYASLGMPIYYNHWSYGKHFVSTEQNYSRGDMGLAYEIVINSNPCIAYLMEENTSTMQALVIAHACYGHNSFFKGNYLFRNWTDAEGIVDYLVFAKNFITQCEERHGVEAVEAIIDSCHALMNYGVDRYKRPKPISVAKEKLKQEEREEYIQRHINDLWRTLPTPPEQKNQEDDALFLKDPQENILYFIEKNAPHLDNWQREIIRIVRKVAQYFYPQRQTQVMNEGWATFWHYTLLYELYDEGLVDDGFMFEFLSSHTSVIAQPDYDSKFYSGINPYALGFAMMTDIRNICEDPTEEDKRWFPDIAGSDWSETLDHIMRNYRDESFIEQFLSPKVMRDFHLFSIEDNDDNENLRVTAIHNDEGYRQLRRSLSEQYNLGDQEPNIQVHSVDIRGDRSLTLHHYQGRKRRPLNDNCKEMLRHVHRLWGYDVNLYSINEDNEQTQSYHLKK
ncbi:MAG TPA: SpoVR family protein [Thiotrichaceae bacterium]|nr:SpoVR family protein [Thiotrichaceae bacterium]